ncbi:MAG: preprotein translocase, SecA subunit, partial [Verrucomicrobiales bacterium]|nr:preprotein translocase, SecA subunit [Verrucomicrobiales bacterium]
TRKHLFFQFKEQLFYTVDHTRRQVDLTETGRLLIRPDDLPGTRLSHLSSSLALAARQQAENDGQQLDQLRQLTESENLRLHNTLQLLRAHAAYERNVDYVIEDGEIVIVDENTGRKMPGRRWSDGLHQAVEAREGLRIQDENHTLATITLQNYFRLYHKLAGMTGTAETEAAELHDIYGMDVAVIPPHRALRRKDRNSLVFPTRRAKFAAAVELIKTRQAAGQPVLVGTASVEASETLARLLRREGVPHQILNAVNHAREAELIAQAGLPGVVTVSTNMAGRGTDIKLGPGVDALGGLFVLGTERYESRRIDRQLRGRCGRQGDPGESLFLLSLEDGILQKSDSSKNLAGWVGKSDGPQNLPRIAAALDAAQRKLEQSHATQRKHTLDMDDVQNRQRKIVYNLRDEAMDAAAVGALLTDITADAIGDKVHAAFAGNPDESTASALLDWGDAVFHQQKPWRQKSVAHSLNPDALVKHLTTLAHSELDRLGLGNANSGNDSPPGFVDPLGAGRMVISVLDARWREHLTAMDSLRDGIHLQYVAQKDPLVEYRRQAFQLFEEMLENVRHEILSALIHIGSRFPAVLPITTMASTFAATAA